MVTVPYLALCKPLRAAATRAPAPVERDAWGLVRARCERCSARWHLVLAAGVAETSLRCPSCDARACRVEQVEA